MKKILWMYLVLGLLFCNVGFTEQPKYDQNSINININLYNWKHISKNFSILNNTPIEIITLTKEHWMLKCIILYNDLKITTLCEIP